MSDEESDDDFKDEAGDMEILNKRKAALTTAAGEGKGKTKVGRNDPCPCNSGKKYKVCCMLKDEDTTSSGSVNSITPAVASLLTNRKCGLRTCEYEFIFSVYRYLRGFLFSRFPSSHLMYFLCSLVYPQAR